MNDKKQARLAGIFYIVATIAGAMSIGFTEPILSKDNYLAEVASNETEMAIGVILLLIMAIAVSSVAIAVYPVLKRYNESIALGYVGARLVESVVYIFGIIALLALIPLSEEFVDAGAPDDSYFHTLSEMLVAVQDWGAHVVLDVAVFPIGVLLFYVALYQTKLVPRWLSGAGLIAGLGYWIAGLLILFQVIESLSSAQIALNVPLALQEMVLAIWLIVRGFDTTAIDDLTS